MVKKASGPRSSPPPKRTRKLIIAGATTASAPDPAQSSQKAVSTTTSTRDTSELSSARGHTEETTDNDGSLVTPISIDVTGYWNVRDSEGVDWTYLFMQSSDHRSGGKPLFGKVAGRSVKLYCVGDVVSDTEMVWSIAWPADKNIHYLGTISRDAQTIQVRPRIQCGQGAEMVMTRLPESKLSVQRSAVLHAMHTRMDGEHNSECSAPKSETVAPAIAHQPVRTLGFQFALLPVFNEGLSPPVLIDEVTSGSWAHGVGMTPGDEILTINGECARTISPLARFMELVRCRPVTFTFRKPSMALVVSSPSALYSVPKSKADPLNVKDSASASSGSQGASQEDQTKKDQTDDIWNTFSQKRIELWMFEGTWQLTSKGAKAGECQMGREGKGTLLLMDGGSKEKMPFSIKGDGTQEFPYTFNGWTLIDWRRTKRIWKSANGGQVIWTLMSRPAGTLAEDYDKRGFWKEIEKDSKADRDRALKIRNSAVITEVRERRSAVGAKGLPLHLFTRQENVAWRWEGVNKPLRKDVVDADSWNDEL